MPTFVFVSDTGNGVMARDLPDPPTPAEGEEPTEVQPPTPPDGFSLAGEGLDVGQALSLMEQAATTSTDLLLATEAGLDGEAFDAIEAAANKAQADLKALLAKTERAPSR